MTSHDACTKALTLIFFLTKAVTDHIRRLDYSQLP